MTPLIRKEIRLILPFWGIALALAVVPVWILVDGQFLWSINGAVFWLLGFGLLLLGLAPFGQEFGLGTFSSMLAQPLERGRIWKIKILLIAAAAALVFMAFIVTLHTRIDLNFSRDAQRIAEGSAYQGNLGLFEMRESQKHMGEAFREAVKTSLLLIAVAITGGLWTTLLFRQTGAAMWFAVLIPGVLVVLIGGVLQSLWPQAQDITLASVLVLYSLAGLLWARRMFADAQDSQWLGETVAMLSLSPAKRQADTAVPRRKGILRALVHKEFQSHQISLFIAFGLLVLHLCTLVFRSFETLPRNSELRFAIRAVPFLWLFVPWLIGCVTVAEERKLGTMESQLCLPVSRRFQFATKLAIALLLGITLGGIMPSLMEWIGTRFHISSEIIGTASALSNPVSTFPYDLHEILTAFQGVFLMCIGAAFIAMVSFFASTLSRNTLHALGGAVVFGVAFFMLFQWVNVESNEFEYSFWKGPLIFIFGVPVAVITVVWLSFSNYKRLHAGRNVWLRNLLILFAALFFTGIVTAIIYQRPWELAMSLEPHHGPSRLTGPIQPAICMTMGRVFALLPDGRLWTGADYREKQLDEYEQVWDSQGQSNRWQKITVRLPASGLFLGGSNWVALAANGSAFDVAALQSDGTLWQILAREGQTNNATWFSLEPQPRRMGSDTDWKCVATSAQRYFLAVKTDGTLWGWGNNDEGRFAPDSHHRIREPVRIGTDSDWAMVFSRYSEPLLMKTDGAILQWLKVDREARFEMRRSNLNGKDWLAVAGSGERSLVLRRDGTLWGSGYLPRVLFGTRNSESRRRDTLTRVGGRSDWAQISGDYFFSAIRKDGSLVENETELFSSILRGPSRYSDWFAVDSGWNGLVAMASDGTVSLWRESRSRGGSLLAPTHQPLWNLNIFSDSKN